MEKKPFNIPKLSVEDVDLSSGSSEDGVLPFVPASPKSNSRSVSSVENEFSLGLQVLVLGVLPGHFLWIGFAERKTAVLVSRSLFMRDIYDVSRCCPFRFVLPLYRTNLSFVLSRNDPSLFFLFMCVLYLVSIICCARMVPYPEVLPQQRGQHSDMNLEDLYGRTFTFVPTAPISPSVSPRRFSPPQSPGGSLRKNPQSNVEDRRDLKYTKTAKKNTVRTE